MNSIVKLDNYDLFVRPNGVYRASEVEASNYLYPMYAYREGQGYCTSTSVYQLIAEKGVFIRNPKFQTTTYYRPTYLTIDQDIFRVRTQHRRSVRTLTDGNEIVELGAQLIQSYVTEIETKFPQATHILLMGGKDSQNILLADRKSPWVVVSGDPNASLNKDFVENNFLELADFIACSDSPDNRYLADEIAASDCFYDLSEMRYLALLKDLVSRFDNNVVVWLGTSGDGIFSENSNHRDQDYFAVHELHVGMAMGIYHQTIKNMLGVPAVSPYQSPQMLDELFFKFDPFFINVYGDVRSQIGELLLGRRVWYPKSNPGPNSWRRNRKLSISAYIDMLRKSEIPINSRPIKSALTQGIERVQWLINIHSTKRRTRCSRFLYPVRKYLSKIAPKLKSQRHNIQSREIT